MKRRSVTEQFSVSGGDYGPVKDMTGNQSNTILAEAYRQPDLSRMIAHVDDTRKSLRTTNSDVNMDIEFGG